MGETVIEKIIHHNTGKQVKPGDIATVSVDRVMIHDIFIPFVAEKFEEMGFQKLWDPDKAVLIYDHLVPASQLDDTRHFHTGDAFAEKQRDFRKHPLPRNEPQNRGNHHTCRKEKTNINKRILQ